MTSDVPAPPPSPAPADGVPGLPQRLAEPRPLLAPGVYDALSALIAEQAGFEALYLSGASIAYTRLGRSDIGLTTATEVAETLACITDRVALPVIVDADTGFGNALNTQRTVRSFERAGAAMIQLEDQGFPKRCGHLDGKDVARKLVILARELGLATELADVEVDSLVPTELATGTIDGFMTRLPELDAAMQARLEAARANGEVLRFVASLDATGKARVGLRALPLAHAFANGKLTDNFVQFTTARYNRNPLVVQGPGAGPEVTAAGVFADLLRVAAYLGARV